MDYLYIINCIFWTIAVIFALGFTIRFYWSWIEEGIKRKIEREKKQTAELPHEMV